jgi:hypothetical protein
MTHNGVEQTKPMIKRHVNDALQDVVYELRALQEAAHEFAAHLARVERSLRDYGLTHSIEEQPNV